MAAMVVMIVVSVMCVIGVCIEFGAAVANHWDK